MHRLLAVTATLGLAVGCGGVRYEKDIEPTFTRSCAAVECHFDASFESGLNLSEGNGYDALVGVAATQSTMVLVDPESPDTSYLWHKLNDTHGPHDDSAEATDSMPPVGPLSVDDLAAIEDWILAGAPK
ncbi:MAG: hypothetical protein KC912_07040 [Proteobacteria bacterium]|nr:hypothetical protein [Pseudomonadota bacterium]